LNRRSRYVDDLLAAESRQNINKILLLGAGDSGKSTLLKQMIIIHGEGFDNDDQRKIYKSVIFNNVIMGIKSLCNESKKFQAVSPANEKCVKMIEALTESAAVNQKIADAVRTLWADPGIQETYRNRSKFQLGDSTKYFFERLDDISQDNYIPIDQDILCARASTTGIVEQRFIIEENVFQMFDVGGQRSERRKWIHCFEKVTAVLFVAAISAFDQTLFEDETTNRMVEALTLCKEIFNSEWFEKTTLILFLNKCDLFEDKLVNDGIQLRDFFKDFDQENEVGEAKMFIQTKFEACCDDVDRQEDIYCHFTQATDTEQMEFVFDATKDSIIKAGLARAGLM